MNTTFYPTKIAKVVRETESSIVVELAVKKEHFPAFRAGQYLTLRAKINGKKVQRAYSLCTAPHENTWRVAIKKVESGAFSQFAYDHFKAGDEIEVMGPHGQFVADTSSEAQKNYVFFAAGSGITPIISLISDILYTEPKSRLTLFYVNKTSGDTLFRKALDHLKKQYYPALDIYYFYSQEGSNGDLFTGRIDRAKCKRLLTLPLIDTQDIDAYYLCGPQAMIMDIQEVLMEDGVQKDQIHFELFTVTTEPKTEPEETSEPSDANDQPQISQVKVTLMGEDHEFEAVHDNRSILEHAINQGIDVPYSCQGGVCSTCRAKLIEGEVDMQINFALVDSEVEEGYRLTCQSLPVSEKIHVNYDE